MKYKIKKAWFMQKMRDITQNLKLMDSLAECEYVSEALLDGMGKAIDTATDILMEVMGDDNKDASWILYWLYDLECGKNASDNSVVNVDGTPVPLATLDDLWEAIRKEHERENC